VTKIQLPFIILDKFFEFYICIKFHFWYDCEPPDVVGIYWTISTPSTDNSPPVCFTVNDLSLFNVQRNWGSSLEGSAPIAALSLVDAPVTFNALPAALLKINESGFFSTLLVVRNNCLLSFGLHTLPFNLNVPLSYSTDKHKRSLPFVINISDCINLYSEGEDEGEADSSSEAGVSSELFFEYIKNPVDMDESNRPQWHRSSSFYLMTLSLTFIYLLQTNLPSRGTHPSQILPEPPHFHLVRVNRILVLVAHVFFDTFFKFKKWFVPLFVSTYGAYIGCHKPSEYAMEVVRVTTLEAFGALGIGATYRF